MSALPDAPTTEDAWPEFFGELAPRYDAVAFGTPGLAYVSARELELVRRGLNGRAAGQVLDIGAGTGRITETLLAIGWRVTAVDASAAMLSELERAFPSVETAAARLGERLPFADSSFDAVVSLRVVKYVADLDAALREIARVLRPGGRAVIEFPNARSCAAFGYLAAPVHLRRIADFERAMTTAGIAPTDRRAGTWLPQPFWSHARSASSAGALAHIDRAVGTALGGDARAIGARSVIVVGERR